MKQSLRKAREEREDILKEARDVRDKILLKLREKLQKRQRNWLKKPRAGIESEKRKALSEIHDRWQLFQLRLHQNFLERNLRRQASRKN